MDILKAFNGLTAIINNQITRLIVSAVKRSFRNKNLMRRDVSQIKLLVTTVGKLNRHYFAHCPVPDKETYLLTCTRHTDGDMHSPPSKVVKTLTSVCISLQFCENDECIWPQSCSAVSCVFITDGLHICAEIILDAGPCWDRGYESHREHGRLSVVSVVCVVR